MSPIVAGGCFGLLLLAWGGCHQEPCSAQQGCRERGLCVGQGTQCVAGTDADCKASIDCKVNGHCGAQGGRCVALAVQDCRESRGCKDRGRCFLVDDVCSDQPADRDTREGCPCGCDHSVEMAAELRALPDANALGAIDETLRTIAEREDAGYITEAMVEHRMRMLDLLAELEPPIDDGRWRDRGVPLGDAAPLTDVYGDSGSLRARAELSAHGEATEIVRGKEKLLRASFRVGLSLENKTSAALTVGLPVIHANVGMPISRWYELGSDGRPWDGVLAPGETKLINVIGYLSEPVAPGTALRASVSIDSVSLETSATASAHWAAAP